jgi:hypothetical protein
MQAEWSGELGVVDFIFTVNMEAYIELNWQSKLRNAVLASRGKPLRATCW